MYRASKEFLDNIKTGDTVSVVVPSMSPRREDEVVSVVVKRGRKLLTVVVSKRVIDSIVTEGPASLIGRQFSLETGLDTTQTNYRPFIVESEDAYRSEVDRCRRQQRVVHALDSLMHQAMTIEEIVQLEAIEAAIIERNSSASIEE